MSYRPDFTGRLQNWGGRWGSNPRPPESQSGALPTELRPPLAPIWTTRFRSRSRGLRTFIAPAHSTKSNPARSGAGAPGRTRTCNPQLRRLMLYPLSYGRAFSGTTRYTSSKGERFQIVGRGGRIRTADPLLPKQLRYQAALHPECQCAQFNSKESRPRHAGLSPQKGRALSLYHQ